LVIYQYSESVPPYLELLEIYLLSPNLKLVVQIQLMLDIQMIWLGKLQDFLDPIQFLEGLVLGLA
jgi:hypothetical protein